MQPSITIRMSTAEDAKAVATVFRVAFAPLRAIYRPSEHTAARQPLGQQEGTRLVAELDQQVVATVQFDSHEDYLHVIGLAVHPQHQQKGIARRLLDWIDSQALSAGRTAIVLRTIEQTGNVPVFERLGFRSIDEGVSDRFESGIYPELYEVKMRRTISSPIGKVPRELP
ncbi:GCN5-related N-acetyltransferase domain protein [Rhodopirellula maiorica SM1]|uniref:GCN5-related N-acetyltransferase domain protein n=1 Tax=Rhodopirellula maiorica SM1 TaxID=1265738 RepID=M5RSQ3_9BACT|nr:GNAT family N-acetyltransferase [Rhodopirellula maiorica]EMI22305.1 GCN5-related N-acetyltransferase domain protein [Rhodopirellula maiorica SM1]